jgi:hypothetical protein
MGVVYLSRTQFMPYHAMALGKIWPDIDQALQILLLALMKAFGGASLAVGVGMAILLFIPFRRGVLWARCAIPVVGVVAELPALYATLSVAHNTPATPPWIGVLLIMVLLIAGFVLSMERKRGERAVT